MEDMAFRDSKEDMLECACEDASEDVPSPLGSSLA